MHRTSVITIIMQVGARLLPTPAAPRKATLADVSSNCRACVQLHRLFGLARTLHPPTASAAPQPCADESPPPRIIAIPILQCFISMGITSIVWCIIGFSLAFGEDNGHGIIGSPASYTLFDNMDGCTPVGYPMSGGTGTMPGILFAGYQMMFAIISPALITGDRPTQSPPCSANTPRKTSKSSLLSSRIIWEHSLSRVQEHTPSWPLPRRPGPPSRAPLPA